MLFCFLGFLFLMHIASSIGSSVVIKNVSYIGGSEFFNVIVFFY